MALRRAHNEGTIYQRPDGLWVAQISLPNGKRKSKYGKTQKIVKDWLQDQKEAVKNGGWVGSEKITLSAFFDRYITDVASHTLRQKTLDSYKFLFRKHIAPELGEVKLSQLRPDHLQGLYSLKLNQGLSNRTVHYIHAVIHKSLNQALKWGLVPRNVADLVDAPKTQKKTPTALTAPQAKRLLEAVRNDRLFALYVLAITTGMRVGELTGLDWKNIDMENGLIHISQAVQFIEHKGLIITEPKTAKSKRTIKLSIFAIEALKEHNPKDKGLVFTTSNGTPFSPRNILRHFHAVCEKAELPSLPFHSLRHTFASIMLSQNIHPKVVQEMLGHSTISLTLDLYSHLLPDMQDEAARKMNALLIGEPK